MDLFSAIILGIVQGFTEFLPVSSSAHLIFAQALIPSFSQPGILFDVFLHGGTLLAVLIYFRKTILELVTFKNLHLMWILILGTIPAGLAGFFLESIFEEMFSWVWFAAATLLISGVMNWFVDGINKRIIHSTQGISKLDSKEIGVKKAIIIGIFQAIAIIPGISRSSATIFSGVFLGIEKQKAAEFSFLLSIPAIAGAIVLQVAKYGVQVTEPLPYVLGSLGAFIVGYWSIGFLLNLLTQNKYKIFGLYCFFIGTLVLILEMM